MVTLKGQYEKKLAEAIEDAFSQNCLSYENAS
jgi:hypothetical protein